MCSSDLPGVLPPQLDDQRAALLLAICDDIGQAAYDTELVGLAFLSHLGQLEAQPLSGMAAGLLEARYGAGGLGGDGSAMEEAHPSRDPTRWLSAMAQRHTSGETTRMAQRLLDDFRRGVLGPLALEVPGRVLEPGG